MPAPQVGPPKVGKVAALFNPKMRLDRSQVRDMRGIRSSPPPPAKTGGGRG